MDAASPTKRRVLATLDPNTSGSPRPELIAESLKPSPQRTSHPDACPQPSEQEAVAKRPRAMTDDSQVIEPSAKKACTEAVELRRNEEQERPTAQQIADKARSTSPEASSLFDASGLDSTQATNITEPDLGRTPTARAPPMATAAQPRSGRFTREETREKIEILRLRLGLANYKLSTGQTDVPLEQLQLRPLLGKSPIKAQHTQPPTAPARRPLPGAPLQRRSSEDPPRPGPRGDPRYETASNPGPGRPRRGSTPERVELPRLPAVNIRLVNTPRRGFHDDDEERLTSSALRGGAATGLLSLARG